MHSDDSSDGADMEPSLEIYHKLCQQFKVAPHWENNNCISLVDIPKSMEQDQWIMYITYTTQYEMDKLKLLDELIIKLPKYMLDDNELDEIQQQIQEFLQQDISDTKIDQHCISFVLRQCKDKFRS